VSRTKPAATPRPPRPFDMVDPLAVDASRLAAMLSVSLRTIRSLDASGRIPRGIVLGGRRKVWSLESIKRWLAEGAPSRKDFEEILKTRSPNYATVAQLGVT
jgi:predicted DNA-binding transcriptional regulator AlpA